MNLMWDIWALRCSRNCSRSSTEPGHTAMMSSRNLIQVSGRTPDQVASAFSSTQAIKRLANGGAHLVPIATPLVCSKNLS